MKTHSFNLSPNFSGTWNKILITSLRILARCETKNRENLRNKCSYLTRAKFRKCFLQKFSFYLWDLDTTKRHIKKHVFDKLFTYIMIWYLRAVYFSTGDSWQRISHSCDYRVGCIISKQLNGYKTPCFSPCKIRSLVTLWGLYVGSDNGLRVWNSGWRPLIICLLITLSS